MRHGAFEALRCCTHSAERYRARVQGVMLLQTVQQAVRSDGLAVPTVRPTVLQVWLGSSTRTRGSDTDQRTRHPFWQPGNPSLLRHALKCGSLSALDPASCIASLGSTTQLHGPAAAVHSLARKCRAGAACRPPLKNVAGWRNSRGTEQRASQPIFLKIFSREGV
jgi:hypothetical protein